MRDVRAQLTEHVGGSPSVTQAMLIEQAAQLALRIAAMDAKHAAAAGEMSLHDARTYLAWANGYTRILARLGLKGDQPTADPGAALAAHQAAVIARRTAALEPAS